jgi:hypothetical protein
MFLAEKWIKEMQSGLYMSWIGKFTPSNTPGMPERTRAIQE